MREAADIVQIIGEHVNLRKTGADYRGPCPFHQGKHRNFSVTPRKNAFYCFVCHESGDVFSFLQKHLGLDWPTAVRQVAERVGVEIHETQSRANLPDEREPLWEVVAAAAEYFRRELWESDGGRPAREYLETRDISREVAEQFGLGFAPRDASATRAYLSQLGYDDARQLDAGLLGRREETGEIRPRFRGRLTIPIHDAAGRHVGFGARVIGTGEPKYLNSPESRVFSKSRLLYGLHRAKHIIRREDRVLVVEGYFDALRLVAAGVEWVVAPLGTALADDQAALLRRYTRNAFLLYDSDQAGLKATFRAGDQLLAHGFAVQVVTLPNGEDPDSFVASHGGAKLLAQVGVAVDVFERKIQLLERGGWFADLQRKRRALDRLLPTIRATADALTRDIYVTRGSEAAGVSKELFLREVEAGASSRAGADVAGAGVPPPTPPREEHPRARTSERRRTERRQAAEPGTSAERELIRVMLLKREEVERLAERVGTEDFRDPGYRAIFQALLSLGPEATADEIVAAIPEESVAALRALLEEPGDVQDLARSVSDSLRNLECRRIAERFAQIDRLQPLADGSAKDEFLRERATLQKRGAQLGCLRGHYGKRTETKHREGS